MQETDLVEALSLRFMCTVFSDYTLSRWQLRTQRSAQMHQNSSGFRRNQCVIVTVLFCRSKIVRTTLIKQLKSLAGKSEKRLLRTAKDQNSVVATAWLMILNCLVLVSFGRTNGSDIVFSNKYGKLLLYRLNKKGLKIHPWRTPLEYEKGRVLFPPILMEHVELQ